MGSFLDKAYGAKTADEVRRLYDDWSASYEDEIGAAGYATPVRVAEALAEAGAWFTEPVLDFGCGTGLGGKALYDIGFDVIDGVDISAEMLARAEAKGLYRTLTLIRPDDPPPEGYGTIAAIGVIGPGAGPIDLIDRLLAALAPGGLLAFSLNDHALSHPEYPAKVTGLATSGAATLRLVRHGPHLPGIGMESKVFVFQRP
jgi:predicted TPR repeat methyltransferase